jgi:hypothetical protein
VLKSNLISDLSQKASTNMSTQTNPVITTAKLVVADPGQTPAEVKVGLGGTLEFRNHFHEFPDFEIEFEKPGPPCESDKLTGTIHDPIFVHMPDADATFYYHILYKEKDGPCKRREGVFLARSCPGCR